MSATDPYRLVDLVQTLEAERDRARDIAVALEQENAALREWLEFVRWGIVE